MTQVYDQNLGQWVNRPDGNVPPPTGTSRGPGGTYLRSNNPANSVEGRTNSLLRSDSDYMQINAKKGQQFAAGRGLLNSSLAAQASRQGAVAGALPIAQADAQLSAQADAQNVDALNAVQIAELNRQTASAQGGSNAYVGNALDAEWQIAQQERLMRLASELNISEAEAGRIFEREMAQGDREWRSSEANADRAFRGNESGLDRNLTREEWGVRMDEADRQRGWQTSEAERDRQFSLQQMGEQGRQQMFASVLTQSLGTLFSSPDYWRDPAGASGFLDFFTNQFGSLYNQFFGGATAPGGG
jgi:hypothetical protein